ncbi:transposase [Paenibacillus sp. GCM10012306]|uniref:transposase n=1 Tax=Paenibacillus sp. GCM10012306 TaxID=3317342 RepID=UPI003607A339
MTRKGQVFQQYAEDFKMKAVKGYFKGSSSHNVVAEMLGIRSSTQLKAWVRKHRDGEAFGTRKGLSNPMKG